MQLGADTETLAKLNNALATGVDIPPRRHAIGPEAHVVINEAGMAGSSDLARAVEFVTEAGGSVRLISDDRQPAAFGAGGRATTPSRQGHPRGESWANLRRRAS